MESSIKNELYPDSFHMSNLQSSLRSTSDTGNNDSHNRDWDDVWNDDGDLCHDSTDKLDKTSEMDREWQRRHDQFHTIGYRDGLMAGKETSAQEGSNIGFRDSVYVGYNWGLVRGITSAFASLPDDLIERMVDTKEIQYKFQHLHESVQSLSTTEVLRCSMIICQRNRKRVVKMINPAPAWPMPMTSAPMTIFWTITRKSYNQLLMNQGSNCT